MHRYILNQILRCLRWFCSPPPHPSFKAVHCFICSRRSCCSISDDLSCSSNFTAGCGFHLRKILLKIQHQYSSHELAYFYHLIYFKYENIGVSFCTWKLISVWYYYLNPISRYERIIEILAVLPRNQIARDHRTNTFCCRYFFFHMYLFNSINTHLHLQNLPGSGRSDNIIKITT